MKKILVIVLLFLSSIVFVSKLSATTIEKSDVEITSEETKEKLIPIYGNLIQNPLLKYTDSNTTINFWKLYGGNDQGLPNASDRRQLSHLSSELANEKGFRKLVRNVGSSDYFDHFRLGKDNITGISDSDEKNDGYSSGGNFLARASHSSKTAGEDGKSTLAYILLTQHITNIVANTEYVYRIDYDSNYTSAIPRGQLIVYEGDRIFTYDNENYANYWSTFSAPKNGNKSATRSYNTANAISDKNSLTVAARIHPNASNDPTATLNIRRLVLTTKVDYDIQIAVNNLFIDADHQDVKYETKAEYLAKVSAINDQLANNNISTEVRSYVTSSLEKAAAQRKVYDDIFDSIDALYTDGSKTVILDNVTEQALDEIKTKIDATKGSGFKQELNQRLSDVRILKNKQDKKKDLSQYADLIKDKLDELGYLGTNKQSFIERIDNLLTDKNSKIDSGDNISSVNTIYEQAINKLDEIFLDAKKENGHNQIDQKVEQLRGEETLSDELKVVINEAKTKINGQDTPEKVDTEVLKQLDKVELWIHKEDKIKEIEDYQVLIYKDINGYETIGGNNQSYKERIQAVINNGKTTITEDETISGVNYTVEQIKRDIVSIKNEAHREEVTNKITVLKNEALYKISNDPNLGDTRDEYYEGRVNTAINNAVNGVNLSTSETEINQIYENLKVTIQGILNEVERDSTASLEERKEAYKNDLLNQKESYVDRINKLTNLDEKEMLDFIKKIEDEYQKTIDLIKDATEINDASDIHTIGSSELNKLYENASLQDEKNAVKVSLENQLERLKNRVNEINLDDEEKQYYIDALTSEYENNKGKIDSSTTITQINTARDGILENYEDIMLQAYIDSAKSSINDANKSFQEKINEMKGLSETEIEKIIEFEDIYKSQKVTEVQGKTTRSEVVTLRQDVDNYYKDLIDLYQKKSTDRLNAQKQIDDKVKELIGDQDINNSLQEVIDEYKNNIMKSETNEEVSEILDEAISNIEQNIIDNIKITQDSMSDEIKNKFGEPLSNEVNQIIIDGVQKINAKNYNNENILGTIKNEIELEVSKQVSYEEVDKFIENKNITIDSELQEIIDTGKVIIGLQTDQRSVKTSLDDLRSEIDKYLSDKVSDMQNSVRNELREYSKDMNSDKIASIIEDQVDKVNETNYNDDDKVTDIINEGKLKILREQSKKDLNDYFNERFTVEEAEELKNQLNEINDLIDAKVISDDIISEKEKGIALINSFENEKVISKKEELKEQLEEHAKKPISEEVQTIIDKEIEKITKDNYKDEEAIKTIVADGKTKIDAQELKEVKDNVRKELEDVTKKPISEEVQTIIDESVEKITNDNYKDDDTMETIITDGKMKIDAQELKEAKDNVRSELEDMMSKPISEEIHKIIEEQVDRITKENYKNEQEIKTIINEGKALIDVKEVEEINAEKEKVRKELEDYAEQPISEKVQAIINNEVDKITKNNYKDEEAIKTIVADAKTRIERVQRNNSYGWIIVILSIIVIGEIIMIMLKRKNNNKKRLNSIAIPFLFFAINERLGKAIIIVLIVIILILLVYLVYLFIEVKKEKEVKVEKKEEIKVSEEKPVVTKKIEKEVVQQPIVIEKKKEIEPVIIKEVKKEPKEELIVDNGLYIRYNYSFVARMHQAPKESQERFSEIKNYLLSYEGVTVRKSWRNERFMYQGKPIAKFWIHGNILDAYLNLDYEMLKDTKYEVEDLRGKRLHENTPVLFKVVGSRTLDYLKELIDMYMESVKGIKGNEQNVDYTVPYISKEELLKKDLIKVNYNK